MGKVNSPVRWWLLGISWVQSLLAWSAWPDSAGQRQYPSSHGRGTVDRRQVTGSGDQDRRRRSNACGCGVRRALVKFGVVRAEDNRLGQVRRRQSGKGRRPETGNALIGHCPQRRFGTGDLQGAPPLVDAVGVQGWTGIAAGRAVDAADDSVGP